MSRWASSAAVMGRWFTITAPLAGRGPVGAGVTAAAGRGDLAPEVLAERLLLAIHAYGTNTGIRAIAGNAF